MVNEPGPSKGDEAALDAAWNELRRDPSFAPQSAPMDSTTAAAIRWLIAQGIMDSKGNILDERRANDPQVVRRLEEMMRGKR